MAGCRQIRQVGIGRQTYQHLTTSQTPLSYTEDTDGSLLLPGGGAWKLNLEGGRSVQVRLRGIDRLAVPEVIWDASEIERLLPQLFKGNPQGVSFVGVPIGPDGKPDPEKHLF